jgi:2-(1,2-epoxy-1,2-dihydrophenyl)acetyl-CoA isomerase
MAGEPVILEAEGGVAEIRFNRPEVLNALDGAAIEGFVAAVDRALGDPGTRVVLLTGEGRAFMAGGDVRSFHEAEDPRALVAERIGPLHAALLRLAEGRAVTVAAAQGAVAGAGLSLFAGADLGILAEDAVLSLAYLGIGACPDCGATQALVRHLGERRAMGMALLGDRLSAAEALAAGLANRVVPAEALRGEALALCRRLAEGPAEALARTRALIRAAGTRGLAAQLDAEAEGFVALAGTADFAEGTAAFVARRAPRFGGAGP